jgi:pimeloyl-ACP methyl ester carboxylesterase
MNSTTVRRTSVDVDGRAASYLTVGDGPVIMLLHGTFWSRVCLPVVGPLAAAGLRPVAVDPPGCGRSEDELTLETATVPKLAAWLVDPAAVADALSAFFKEDR